MRKIIFPVMGILFFLSCQKIETVDQAKLASKSEESKTSGTKLSSARLAASTTCSVTPIIDSMPNFDIDADSTEQSTILGNQRTNPYTVANMKQAYTNLGLSGMTVNVTNLYVRFLPNSVQQLSTLDSTLDSQGLDLFDTPMDYDVLQEGDYYQDPSIPDTSVTWQYAVVPPNFVFPSGISYQVLSQIHIPGDAYSAVETEGERPASIQDSINCSGGGVKAIVPYVPYCGPGYHWDFTQGKCVCDCCPSGYQWNGTQCVPIPPPPPNPPPPSPDAQIPAGTITVSDVNLGGNPPGVRIARIVAKRWFKIERTYTDNNGYFQCTKHFKHRVKIVVKFQNNYSNIYGIRGLRLWQSLFVIKKTIGVYGSNKNSISYIFVRYNTSTSAKGNRYWTGATIINTVREHRDYGASYGFSAPPLGLNIYITNWGYLEGLASTPLFGKRFDSNIPSSYINTMLVGGTVNAIPLIGWYASFFASIARTRLDMAIDYHKSDMTKFTSDFIKETVYHELSHASDYTQVGTSWYTNFVNAELAEIAAHPTASDPFNPYGTGNTSNSPIIALGEAWGYHMGHFLAEQRYGTTASCQNEQNKGLTFCNNSTTGTGHPHADVLEYFDPNLSTDPLKWIPKGLMWDLMDNGEPTTTHVIDNVSGFTIQQIFSALQSDVNSVQQYKSRFIQQNPGNQTSDITTLFGSYNY